MSTHAFLSASGAPAWTRCLAKPGREKGLPDQTSVHASEGTAAHAILEGALKAKDAYSPDWFDENYPNHPAVPFIQDTLAFIMILAGEHKATSILSEQKLDIGFITGEKDATGTADVVILCDSRIIVVDLKYGMGDRVRAKDNEQLLMYGAAVLNAYGNENITTLQLAIAQPRLSNNDTWEISVKDTMFFVEMLRRKAKRILTAKGGGQYLPATPGEKQCKYCKVAATCPERTGFVVSTVTSAPADISDSVIFLKKVETEVLAVPSKDDASLATCLEAADMIEDWCRAVREEVRNRLHNGRFSDSRFKLVEGREGNRKWENSAAVYQTARELGINTEEITESKLMSPTAVRKILGNTEKWKALEQHISRSAAKKIMVPATDERPAATEQLQFSAIDEEYVDALLGLTQK